MDPQVLGVIGGEGDPAGDNKAGAKDPSVKPPALPGALVPGSGNSLPKPPIGLSNGPSPCFVWLLNVFVVLSVFYTHTHTHTNDNTKQKSQQTTIQNKFFFVKAIPTKKTQNSKKIKQKKK